jgi:uncharacterized membrane protein YfcA
LSCKPTQPSIRDGNKTGSTKPAFAAMISYMTLAYLLLGLIIGAISGIVGTGGGVLIVPALVYFFHMNQHKAQGTSLGALLAPIGILAFWEYHKAGNVDIKAALLIAVGFAIGGYFGGFWAQNLSDVVLRRILGTLLVAIGIHFLLAR